MAWRHLAVTACTCAVLLVLGATQTQCKQSAVKDSCNAQISPVTANTCWSPRRSPRGFTVAPLRECENVVILLA